MRPHPSCSCSVCSTNMICLTCPTSTEPMANQDARRILSRPDVGVVARMYSDYSLRLRQLCVVKEMVTSRRRIRTEYSEQTRVVEISDRSKPRRKLNRPSCTQLLSASAKDWLDRMEARGAEVIENDERAVATFA